MDVEAALRRAMYLERARLAENFIRNEAAQFMRQQAAATSSSQQANMQLVLAEPLSEPEDVTLRTRSSALPPEFASTDEYLAHLSQKHGVKFMTRSRVITPIPKDSQSPTLSTAPTPASSPSDPTPSSTFIQGRIKRTARKRVPPPPRASVLNVSEDESMPHQEEEQVGSSSQTPSLFESAPKGS